MDGSELSQNPIKRPLLGRKPERDALLGHTRSVARPRYPRLKGKYLAALSLTW
jgi:hypothetical protein